MASTAKQQKRKARQRRIRARVSGSKGRPRLAVFRSNKHLFIQIIDDAKHVTLVSLADTDMPKGKGKGVAGAKELGIALAKKAKEAKITKVVFDRRGYAYHGIVKAVAEGAREGGLEF